ncbi:hypothetical protein BCR36DRAFT_448949 [Piromyces finnis]|uniref:Uncharacterized protein n=1 Tax=Piromyces finnis TaxID=1754191 RepID=A0A1Y1U6J0_9FUNG|nr:hypothetical protein BCR36DRAFT_448949 [Piromyces finnis]|eukprot:ORX33612.1 hypothetical protein BCR36DRAFT_448949 [Piromyces finnis]
MQKLKVLYRKKKIADPNYWLKKLYSLKAKNLTDCKDIINQINEIFYVMNRNNIQLGTWEKIRVLYLSFPKNLREKIHPNGNESGEEKSDESTISLVIDSPDNKTIWTFDTGASEHITNNKDILTNFEEEKVILKCAKRIYL